MTDVVLAGCRALALPAPAAETLCAADRAVRCCAAAETLLAEHARLFWADAFGEDLEENGVFTRLDEAARLTGLHRYTVYALFFLRSAPEMKRRYALRGISDEVFCDSFSDFKWKLLETHRLENVWGVFCPGWIAGFFLQQRFCLGRLEFELSNSEYTYENAGCRLVPGRPLVQVHIPESGPLVYERVLDSYRRAAAFYYNTFGDGAIPFLTETWMLYPPVKALLPPGNLRRFTSDFAVIAAGPAEEPDDRWRIFHMPNTDDTARYPEDTSLQRALKAFLLGGGSMGIGTGIFFYRSGSVLPHTEKEVLEQ